MTTRKIIFKTMVLAILGSTIVACQNSMADQEKGLLFPKGEIVNSENFMGTVWLQMIKDDIDTTLHISMGNVTFEAGARTNWHMHPGGQILLITDGEGYYQEKGQQKTTIRKGEIIKCPPNVPHWHGATDHSSMTHMAIGPNTQFGKVIWQHPVSDKEYLGQ